MNTTAPGLHVVVGGGLAGITAALRLADTGRNVMLIESRSRLGGVAGSGERDGRPIDTGVHVMLRCYSRYRALLERLEVADLVPFQERMSIPVALPGGSTSRLQRGPVGPAPVHLVPALARYTALSMLERANAVRVVTALGRLSATDSLDEQDFGSFLAGHHQSARAVRRLWGLFSVAALNLPPDQSSLALAVMTLRTALLQSLDGADIGIPSAPLQQVHDLPARRALERAGVQTLPGCRVLAIAPARELDQVTLEVRGAREHRQVVADSVVVAVPHRDAARICPPDACPDRDQWRLLGASPIVNVHLHLDRPITALPFAATPESATQWVFDRTAAAGIDRGQYLVSSVSAADDHLPHPNHELVTTHLNAVRDLFPGARARLLDSFVTREPRATFRQSPGSARLRPGPRTRWPRLVLAGAWTRTGWPDTLEGAVRSGETAADLVLAGPRTSHVALPQPRSVSPSRTPVPEVSA